MFKRKLSALDHPSADTFSINSTHEFRSAVLWLEDQKIRHYRIEDRANLRDVESPNWVKSFQQYLHDLACPVGADKQIEVIEWLLSYAIRLEYGDNADKYKSQTAENVKKNQDNAPRIVSSNPLDNLDFNSPEFKTGVNALAKLVSVTPHPDHLITLKAVSKVVQQRLSSEALENPNDIIVEGKPFPVQECDLGFETGDYVMNQAAKILRLLYIHDLRDLQTKINECIVAVQSVTANPKTDTRLGKVGF